MNLVPSKAKEIETSPDWKLARTGSTGIKYFVRYISQEVAKSIIIGSHDDPYLSHQKENSFLLVLIRRGRILRGEPKPDGDLDLDDALDSMQFLVDYEGKPPK